MSDRSSNADGLYYRHVRLSALAEVHYLGHRSEIDAYLREGEARFEEMRKRSRDLDPEFRRKMESARRRLKRSSRSAPSPGGTMDK
jgi:hypothetical protein